MVKFSVSRAIKETQTISLSKRILIFKVMSIFRSLLLRITVLLNISKACEFKAKNKKKKKKKTY